MVVHTSIGGCDEPEISKSFSYNNKTDKYEYILTIKQNGICKIAQHYFETVLVKKTDIDTSKLLFSLNITKPPVPTKQ